MLQHNPKHKYWLIRNLEFFRLEVPLSLNARHLCLCDATSGDNSKTSYVLISIAIEVGLVKLRKRSCRPSALRRVNVRMRAASKMKIMFVTLFGVSQVGFKGIV